MSKSEQLKHALLKRAEEGTIALGDKQSIREFLDAVAEEALEEKAKKKKAQAKH